MIPATTYRRLFFVLLIVWTTICLYSTLLPAKYISTTKLWSYDKAGHFILFFLWGLLFSLTRIRTFNLSPSWLHPFLYGSLFGISIEFLQLTLPIGRSFEWMDIVADMLGSLVGGFISIYLVGFLFPTEHTKTST